MPDWAVWTLLAVTNVCTAVLSILAYHKIIKTRRLRKNRKARANRKPVPKSWGPVQKVTLSELQRLWDMHPAKPPTVTSHAGHARTRKREQL